MKIRLTIEEAEQIAHDPGGDPEERRKSAEAAPFYEKMCKRFRDAAEKSKEVVTVDIE